MSGPIQAGENKGFSAGRLIVGIVLLLIVAFWTVPTLGVLVTLVPGFQGYLRLGLVDRSAPQGVDQEGRIRTPGGNGSQCAGCHRRLYGLF